MLVTIILAVGAPPYRVIWEGELPAVPDNGELLEFNARQYQVVQRSWRFGATPIDMTNLGQALNGSPRIIMGCGLLVIDPDNPPPPPVVSEAVS